MAVYSGKDEKTLDLIANNSVSKDEIFKIYNEVCPIQIGELKFVSEIKSLEDKGLVKTNDVWYISNISKFDGWVYPDGSKFLSKDFPEADIEYGSSSSSFEVPNLNNQFFAGTSQAITDVAQKCGLQQHDHSVTDENGLNTILTLPNGLVFCAAGNPNKYRTATYYTHPKTSVALSNDEETEITAVVPLTSVYGISAAGTMPAEEIWFNGKQWEPNWDEDNPSLPYTVPACHSGAVTTNTKKGIGSDNGKDSRKFLPVPIDITLKGNDVAAWFADGETGNSILDESYPEYSEGTFIPSSINIPIAIYIGKRSS